MRVRWTPPSDLALGRNLWAVNAVDGGNTTTTAPVRSFRIETPPWAGDTTLASGNRIRAVHIEQLRTEANDVRSFRNEGVIYVFAPMVFTDPTLTTNVTQIRKVHLDELRSALTGIQAITGSSVTIGADPVITALQSQIRAAHFLELRTALEGL